MALTSRLERLVSDRNTPQKHVWRARIVLLSWEGLGTMEIMRRVGKSKPTVWHGSSVTSRRACLRDRPRGPGKPALGGEVISLVLTKTLGDKPPKATHWSLRTIQGGGHRPQQRAADLQTWIEAAPCFHLQGLERRPKLAEKVAGGRPLSEPAGQGAGVFDGREEPIQALDRTQPGLPMVTHGLQAQWQDHAVRGGMCSISAVPETPPASVPGFLRKLDRAIAKISASIKSAPARRHQGLGLEVQRPCWTTQRY